MTAAAATADASLWAWIGDNIWWILLLAFWFGGGILEFFFGAITGIVHWVEARREHEIKLAKINLKAAQAANRPAIDKAPGQCVHRNVRAVIGTDDEVKAWLCKTCDTQLPADWATRESDL